MRKLFGVVAVLVGLVALVAGVGGAVVVGSDDVVATPSRPLAGDARVAVSRLGLLDYDGWTLRVEAANAGGRVFIGSGHPVDVRDYVAGVRRADVTAVAAGGVETQVVDGRAVVPSGDPTALTFWSARAAGAGTQRLDLDLEAQPLLFYVGPVGAPGSLTLSVGIRIPHLFAAALVVAGLGMLLLVLGVVLLRRGRPHQASLEDEAGVPERDDAVGVRPVPTRRAERRRLRRVGVVLASGLVASGCGAVPQRAGSDPEAARTRPALTRSGLAPVWAAYDRSNNAAIKAAAAPTYDPRPWASVDTGADLLADRFATAYRRAERDTSKPLVLTHRPGTLFAPAFGRYPMYVLATATVTSDGAADKPAPGVVTVSALVRARAAGGWRQYAGVQVRSSVLPEPLAVGSASTPSASDQVKVRSAVAALGTYIATGRGITVTGGIASWRATIDKAGKDPVYEHVAGFADPLGVPEDVLAPGGPVHAVRVSGGLLVLASFHGGEQFQTVRGVRVRFNDTTTAALLGQSGYRDHLQRPLSFVGLISIPDTGAATVIGSETRTLLRSP